MKRSLLLACGVVALLASSRAHADVKVPSVFASHMVVQRDKPVTVWGWADKGESVTVSFGGKEATAKADDKGNWKVALPKFAANARGQTMTIKGNNTLELDDVLIGDVWLGSGQSNMEWSLAASDKPKETIEAAKHPNIRLLHVKKVQTNAPAQDVVLEKNGAWAACTPETARNFSAVLYHFGVRLHKDLDVPIGLINSSWGGSPIQPWTTDGKTSGGMYNAMIAPLQPVALKGIIWYQGESNMAEGMTYRDRTEALVKGWRRTFQQEDLPFYFVQIAPFSGYNQFTTLSDSSKGVKVDGGKMRVPLAGLKHVDVRNGKLANKFEIAGEKGDKGPKYVPAEAAIEKDELVIWGKGVEKPISARYSMDLLPEFWEAQTACLKIPGTGMVVVTDITGNVADIHPRNKFDVGNRLALWALSKTYGKSDLVYSGPLYKGMKVEGDKIRLSFAHGVGLKSRDGKPLTEFEIAGDDGKFVTAEATIEGDEVVLRGKGVEKPTQARFGWRKTTNPNLVNREGLPASPFRTKDWRGGTGE